jgi:hypothetical protein
MRRVCLKRCGNTGLSVNGSEMSLERLGESGWVHRVRLSDVARRREKERVFWVCITRDGLRKWCRSVG